MDMISPNQYREMNQDKTLEELIALKEELQQKLEQISTSKKSYFLSDSRQSVYPDYIEEISKLIQEKSA